MTSLETEVSVLITVSAEQVCIGVFKLPLSAIQAAKLAKSDDPAFEDTTLSFSASFCQHDWLRVETSTTLLLLESYRWMEPFKCRELQRIENGSVSSRLLLTYSRNFLRVKCTLSEKSSIYTLRKSRFFRLGAFCNTSVFYLKLRNVMMVGL